MESVSATRKANEKAKQEAEKAAKRAAAAKVLWSQCVVVINRLHRNHKSQYPAQRHKKMQRIH